MKNFGVSALNNEDIRSLVSKIQPDPAFEFLDVRIFQEGQKILIVGNGNEIHVQVEYIVRQEMHGMRVLIDLLGKNDELLFRTFHDDSVELIPTVKPGRYISTAIIPANFLSPITYTLHIQATVHNVRMLSAHGVRFPLAVANTGVVNRAYVGDPIQVFACTAHCMANRTTDMNLSRLLFVTCMPLETPRSASMAFMGLSLEKYPYFFAWYALHLTCIGLGLKFL